MQSFEWQQSVVGGYSCQVSVRALISHGLAGWWECERGRKTFPVSRGSRYTNIDTVARFLPKLFLISSFAWFWLCFPSFPTHTHKRCDTKLINVKIWQAAFRDVSFVIYMWTSKRREREKKAKEKARQEKKNKGGYQGHRSADFPSCSILQLAMGKRTVGCGQMWALIPLNLILNLPP